MTTTSNLGPPEVVVATPKLETKEISHNVVASKIVSAKSDDTLSERYNESSDHDIDGPITLNLLGQLSKSIKKTRN